MTNGFWIPGLIAYNGKWETYFLIIYSKYEDDFVKTTPAFRGKRIGVIREPKEKGIDWAFWHLIQKDDSEAGRIPDIRRCERICWSRPIIEHCEDPCVKVWENRREGKPRICIWCEPHRYLVILIKKRASIKFLTAYPIESNHKEMKLRKEYAEYIARNATSDGPGTPSTRGR